MPYIKQERRKRLDPILKKLWYEIVREADLNQLAKGDTDDKGNLKDKGNLDAIKGEINYCFTKILVTLLQRYGTRYHILSNIGAIPTDVEDEFRRQFLHPYENKKIKDNKKVEPLDVN